MCTCFQTASEPPFKVPTPPTTTTGAKEVEIKKKRAPPPGFVAPKETGRLICFFSALCNDSHLIMTIFF